MENLADCICRVTQELRNLQELLQFSAFECNDPHAQNRILSELVDIGLIHGLKGAVDHMRQFLWSYIDFATAKPWPSNATDLAKQSARLDQVTEMLSILHRSSPIAGRPSANSSSFVERVTASVGNLLEQYDSQQEKSDGAAA